MKAITPPIPRPPVKRPQTWFDPQPPDGPIRLPRRFPKRIVPSLIGENAQVLNLLFHHGAGVVVRDYSGYGNHGNFAANPVWTDGPFGWALLFDGVTTYLNCGNNASLNTAFSGTELSVDFWVNPNPNVLQYFVSKRDTCVNILERTDDLRLVVNVGPEQVLGVNVVVDGVWQNFTVVFFPLAGTVRATGYKNGAPLLTVNTGVAAIAVNVDPLLIASRVWLAPNGVVDGYMNLVRVCNRTLTPAEIGRRFERTRGIFGV